MERKKLELKAKGNPWFADEVAVLKGVKAIKEGNKVRKEGFIRLGFIDMVKREVFAEIVLMPSTVKALIELLKRNLEELEKELESNEIKLPKATKISKTEDLTYIG